jgi:DNA mismatch endonuclease (patch repair protein)
MAATRGRDTNPELRVRKTLHARGYRYRVNFRPVPGVRRTGDLVFTRARLVVLIDGCYWHACPIHYQQAKTRTDFWRDKIRGNVARDKETDQIFGEAGWTVLRFWEHEECDLVVSKIIATLESAADQPDGGPAFRGIGK